MDKPLLQSLAGYSRQELRVGTPAHFVFAAGGESLNRDLVAQSIQLRIAEALERQNELTAQLLAPAVPAQEGNPINEPFTLRFLTGGTQAAALRLALADQVGFGVTLLSEHESGDMSCFSVLASPAASFELGMKMKSILADARVDKILGRSEKGGQGNV